MHSWSYRGQTRARKKTKAPKILATGSRGWDDQRHRDVHRDITSYLAAPKSVSQPTHVSARTYPPGRSRVMVLDPGFPGKLAEVLEKTRWFALSGLFSYRR